MRFLRTYVCELVSHAVKRYLRQASGTALMLGLAARGLFAGLMLAAAVLAGRYADVLAAQAGVDLLDAISRHYLHAALVLFAVMTVLPERARLDAEPYRHLPISRHGVAAANVIFGLLRLPMPAFVAACIGLSTRMPHPVSWLAASGCLAVGAGLLGSTLHRELRVRPRRFLVIAGGIVVLVLVDLAAQLIATSSVAVSSALFSGAGWVPALTAACAIGAFAIAVRSRMVEPPHEVTTLRRRLNLLAALRSTVLRIAMLELIMLRRCSYARYQLRAIVLLLGLLVALMIYTPDEAYRLVTMLFAVAGVAITYAQLAFAWNSDHVDGLLVLPLSARAHVQARWLVGAILASASAVAMLVLLLLVSDGSVLALAACYLLTLGWLISPLMAMSMRWSQRVSLDGSALGNLKAYSWHLYVVAFGLWVGSHLAVTLTDPATTAILFLGLGLVGVLIQPAVHRRIADDLCVFAPAMAERFRRFN